ETADDAADANAAAESTNAWNEDALPANDQVNFNASLRRAIEGLDDSRIDDRVHFDDHAGGLAAFGVASFAIDQGDAALGEIARCDEQRLVAGLLGVGGEVIEDIMSGRSNFGIAGEQAEIAVEAGGGRIVVTGAEVGVA